MYQGRTQTNGWKNKVINNDAQGFTTARWRIDSLYHEMKEEKDTPSLRFGKTQNVRDSSNIQKEANKKKEKKN